MDGVIWLVFLIPLIGFIIIPIVIFAKRSAAKEAYQQARQAYVDSLEELKRDPQNPDLREQTLALGRQYSARADVCLQSGPPISGVTGFDEVALMNDINAACARAGGRVAGREEGPQPSLEARLAKLDELRSKQLITEQEYQTRRLQILQEI